MKRKFYYVYRSAITGRFVDAAWAKRNPSTTIREKVDAPLTEGVTGQVTRAGTAKAASSKDRLQRSVSPRHGCRR